MNKCDFEDIMEALVLMCIIAADIMAVVMFARGEFGGAAAFLGLSNMLKLNKVMGRLE